MNDLSIGRLSATVTGWPDVDPERVPRMLDHLADRRLEDATSAHPLPDGEWCLRKVDVEIVLDPERPTSALETEWADQIVLALRRSLRDGSEDVVRFDRPEQAIDDMLLGLATAHFDRAWAWRQVGLLTAGDPTPDDGSARDLAIRLLDRLPHGVAPVLCRLVRRAGAGAAHRLLGEEGWHAAATVAARESGAVAVHDLHAAPTRSDPSDDVDRARLAASTITASAMATALRDSGLRTSDPTLEAWAVLALAEVDASMLRGAGARDLVLAIASRLRPTHRSGLGSSSRTRSSDLRSQRSRSETSEQSRSTSGPSERHDGSAAKTQEGETAPPASDVDGSELSAARTTWGGLLFLLNTAAGAGLPECLTEPPFDRRPMPWLLQQLATRLVPALADDPAVLALTGLDEPVAEAPPQPDDSAALDECSASWAAVTIARLRAADPETEQVTDDQLLLRVLRRTATVIREPGWVELHLALDDVDLGVRRAGLDVDPGWVWWLGQIVRFVYE